MCLQASAHIHTAGLSVVFTAGTRIHWAHHQCWRSLLIFIRHLAQPPGALLDWGFSTKWPGLSLRGKCISEISNRCLERISAAGNGQDPYCLEGSRKNLIPCLCGWWFLLVMSASNVVALKGPWGTTGNFGFVLFCAHSWKSCPTRLGIGVNGGQELRRDQQKISRYICSSGGGEGGLGRKNTSFLEFL